MTRYLMYRRYRPFMTDDEVGQDSACRHTAERLLGERLIYEEEIPVEVSSGVWETWNACYTEGLFPPYGTIHAGRILLNPSHCSPLTLEPPEATVTGLLWMVREGKALITHMCVAPALRRKGIGHTLVDAYRRRIARYAGFVRPYTVAGAAFVKRIESELHGLNIGHVSYSKRVGELTVDGGSVPVGYAVRLGHVGKFEGTDLLAPFVPERKTHIFALHPLKWRETFWSLTNKDPHKIVHYRPTLIPMRAGTLVAEMALYNAFEDQNRPELARLYVESLRPVEEVDVRTYRMPELLIPREVP